MDKIDAGWVQKLLEQEYSRNLQTKEGLYLLREAIENTNELSWLEFMAVKYLGTRTGILLRRDDSTLVLHHMIEYNSKYYYIQNENTPTDLHS